MIKDGKPRPLIYPAGIPSASKREMDPDTSGEKKRACLESDIQTLTEICSYCFNFHVAVEFEILGLR